MGTHNLQAFCTATLTDSTNILTDQEFSTDLDRVTGHKQGIARLKLENKVLRQSSVVAASIAEFIVTYCSTAQNYSVADTETPASIAAKLRNVVQNQTFPAGTRLAFSQSTAPLGWVQVNDSSTSGHMLRIINNTTVTGAGTGIISAGGIHSPILMNVVPAHTHGGTTAATYTDHLHSINLNTGTESVVHTHGYERPARIADSDRGTSSSLYSIDGTENGTTGAQNQAHVHNVNGNTGGMDRTPTHAHTFSTDPGSSSTDWQPKYLDFILCSKS
jgi:hypothetical protein